MPAAFVRRNGDCNEVRRLAICAERPLRLDRHGAAADAAWALSIVPFGAERGTPRWTLIVSPGAPARLGPLPPPKRGIFFVVLRFGFAPLLSRVLISSIFAGP